MENEAVYTFIVTDKKDSEKKEESELKESKAEPTKTEEPVKEEEKKKEEEEKKEEVKEEEDSETKQDGEAPAESNAAVIDRLCKFIYTKASDRVRTRAMLCHIYHHALHDRLYEARDLMLISHLQETIQHSDVPTQVRGYLCILFV